MSASRDNSQRFKFVYNLKPIIEASRNPSTSSVQVIKVADKKKGFKKALKVESYEPAQFLPSRKKASAPTEVSKLEKSLPANPALDSLKKNVSQLESLQSKLQFLLKELEELQQD